MDAGVKIAVHHPDRVNGCGMALEVIEGRAVRVEAIGAREKGRETRVRARMREREREANCNVVQHKWRLGMPWWPLPIIRKPPPA